MIKSAHDCADMHLFWNIFALQTSKNAVNIKPLIAFFLICICYNACIHPNTYRFFYFVMISKTNHQHFLSHGGRNNAKCCPQCWLQWHSCWWPSKRLQDFMQRCAIGKDVSWSISSRKFLTQFRMPSFSWWPWDPHCCNFSHLAMWASMEWYM